MGKQSSADIVYKYIMDGITSKTFFPGTRFVEEDLVKRTGVSRTLVRSAFARLKYEGIVENSENRGTYVVRLTIKDIKNVYDIRPVLEIGAFKNAIGRISEEALLRMEAYNKAIEQNIPNFSIAKYIGLNRSFHWEIVLASENKYYEKYLGEIFNNIAVCLLFYNNSHDDTRSLKHHADIINALRTHDEAKGIAAIIEDNNSGMSDLMASGYNF